MAAFLAGYGNLKPKGVDGRRMSSSDEHEYEESDDEKQEEDFQVKKIVDHKKLNKGRVYKQVSGHHTFDVQAMENSKLNYAFRVRWRGYDDTEDTWEPIENFTTKCEKKVIKYCRQHGIKLPDGFAAWMIQVSSDEEETSGSDEEPASKMSRMKTASLSSPSTNRHQAVDKKIDEKRRTMQLKQDLALSPSPSPLQAAKNKKKFDPLFDDSDEEMKRKNKKKDEDRLSDKPSTSKGTPRGTPIGTPRGTPSQGMKRSTMGGSTNNTPLFGKKKRPIEEPSSVESRRKKEAPAKRKKNEESEKKMKDRSSLEKRAAAHVKELAEEERRKKEKKKQLKMENEKLKPAVPEKKRFPSFSDALMDLTVDAPSGSQKKSHHELEKKKKKMLEQKMKEKGLPMKVNSQQRKELHKKYMQKREELRDEEKEAKKREGKAESILKKFVIPKKKDGDKLRDEGKDIEKKEKESVKEVKESGIEKKESVREEREVKEEVDEVVEPVQPAAAARDDTKRIAKAKRRLKIVNQRLDEFAQRARKKELVREKEWEEEENSWRRSMYESGRWKRDQRINDMPFSFRAERCQADARYFRTLRRCTSTERFPHSFRRLSSLHSMDSLPSQADSLAEALIEMQIGEKVKADRLRELRGRFEERKIKEEEEEIDEEQTPADEQDLKGKTEEFVRETLEMARELMSGELMSGEVGEEIIRDIAERAVHVFLSLDYSELPPIIEKLRVSDRINRTLLSLVRIFSPVLNLAEAAIPCPSVCDDGQHRKCKMLLTILMCLSEPHRMGDDESSLLPPNALYDCIECSAPCQIRALIRGGCTFDGYYDDEGRNAAHRMMEKYSMDKLTWLIERGLDVNSAIQPKKASDLESELYDRPWKVVKETNEKAAFISQMHSQRLTARSVVWTRNVREVPGFNLRPLTLVHTLNAHAYFHRVAAVTLCTKERKGFDRDDAVLLAIHSATVTKGKGLRAPARKAKKKVPELRIPYFLIDRAVDDASFEYPEKFACTRARLTVHNLADRSLSETVELPRVGGNGATTVFKVPKKQAQALVSSRRYTETLLKLSSPPEHSVVLAQYFIVPYKTSQGKFPDGF